MSANGNHVFDYNSTDNAGNTEPTQSQSFTITQTDDPVTAINVTGTVCDGGVYVSPVVVELTASDGCSGVEKTVYTLDGGVTWQTYSSPFTVSILTPRVVRRRKGGR